jgi:hypothetical protein
MNEHKDTIATICEQIKALPGDTFLRTSHPDHRHRVYSDSLKALVADYERMAAMLAAARSISVSEGSIFLANVNATVGNMLRHFADQEPFPVVYKWHWSRPPNLKTGTSASGIQGPYDTALEAYAAINYHGYSSKCPENPFCAECGKTVKPADIGFQCETFTSCKSCTEQIDVSWEADKEMLREQGIDPDKCDYIERHIGDTPRPASEPSFVNRVTVCPCRVADRPCRERCSCVYEESSAGCSSCAGYGSAAQRTKAANRIVAQLRPASADLEAQARLFHEAYERLAPQYGYETRPETKVFDATSPNGQLMIAVMTEISAETAAMQAELETLRAATRWVRVEDGLPRTEKDYLVQLDDGKIRVSEFYRFADLQPLFHFKEMEYVHHRVIAWREIEPYQAPEEKTNAAK